MLEINILRNFNSCRMRIEDKAIIVVQKIQILSDKRTIGI